MSPRRQVESAPTRSSIISIPREAIGSSPTDCRTTRRCIPRIITGMITAETANGLTLRRADGTSETVLRIDIEELRSTGVSFMPEGLERQIDVPAMADLLSYLGSVK
jgi:putative heme-binding domain-containing protein